MVVRPGSTTNLIGQDELSKLTNAHDRLMAKLSSKGAKHKEGA